MKVQINQNHSELLKREKIIFLNYLKAIAPVFDNSNIFFRDIQFGIQKFLLMKGSPVNSEQAQILTAVLAKELEQDKILTPINHITWRVNYPAFRTGAPHTFEVTDKVA